MELTLENLTVWFNDFLEKDEKYQEALEIVRSNSKGRMWLIGGYVYKNLARELYGRESKPIKDLDFIVEKKRKEIIIPGGWSLTKSRLGSPKFLKEDSQIDFILMDDVVDIIFYNLERTIANFLERVPFNIHSIVYDIVCFYL